MQDRLEAVMMYYSSPKSAPTWPDGSYVPHRAHVSYVALPELATPGSAAKVTQSASRPFPTSSLVAQHVQHLILGRVSRARAPRAPRAAAGRPQGQARPVKSCLPKPGPAMSATSGATKPLGPRRHPERAMSDDCRSTPADERPAGSNVSSLSGRPIFGQDMRPCPGRPIFGQDMASVSGRPFIG